MLTPWGYEVEELPDLITADEFNAATGGRYESDPRLSSAIAAASSAIRRFCGWHVAPSMECVFTTDGAPGDLWLPCVGLTAVESVEFDGAAQVVKGFNRLGRVRTDRPQPCGLGNVRVVYVAGYDAAAVPDLADVIKDRILASIANGYGVVSESAGGVSVSLAADAASDRGGAFVPASVARALAPYRLVSAHVA